MHGLADSLALRLLACSALAIAFVCMLILPSGPHDADKTQSWVLALVLALPLGFLLASVQERRLAASAPAAAARGVAIGTVLLTLAFIVRRLGSADRLHHSIVLLAALLALLAPFAAARIWQRSGDREAAPAQAIAALSLLALAFVFVPGPALRLSNLLLAIAVAALLAWLLLRPPRRSLPPRWRHLSDAVLCLLLVLVVVQLPPLSLYGATRVFNHNFFLGPANDVLWGRAMLAGAWSQYGVGMIDALAGVFTIVPIGYGTMGLVVIATTVGVYLCLYAILRLAGLGQVLVAATIVVAGVGNLFSPLMFYMLYPSAGPLRFGLPYLIILAAVLGVRYPRRRRAAAVAILALLALGAVWSFESFVYSGVTYGCLVLAEALEARTGVARRVARGAALGLAVSAAAFALFSLVTVALAGSLDWGPYFEYLKLYSISGFGHLPLVLFSAGPIMAATIFFTAVAVVWLVRRYPDVLEPPVRIALVGFAGLALSSFTYYLGRSHPNNLLVIMVPTIAITGLWMHVLLRSRPGAWRTLAVGAVAIGWAVIVVAGWPSVKEKWHTTALALAVPHRGDSLRHELETYAANPAFQPPAPLGVEMLARHLPPHTPALVLTYPDLTTEILMRAGRRNLLPISNPWEDNLISSSFARVRQTAERVPLGTLLLTSPPVPGQYLPLQVLALTILHVRFKFEPVETRGAGTLQLVRLVPHESP